MGVIGRLPPLLPPPHMEEYTQYPPPLRPPSQEIVAAEQRNKVVSKLHAILKPFMLRRLKSDVAIGLPRKAEILLYSQVGRKGAAWKGGGGACVGVGLSLINN